MRQRGVFPPLPSEGEGGARVSGRVRGWVVPSESCARILP